MLKSIDAQVIVYVERLTLRGIHVDLTTATHQARIWQRDESYDYSLNNVQARFNLQICSTVDNVEAYPVGRHRYPRETRSTIPIVPTE